jgi:hypothetical protein
VPSEVVLWRIFAALKALMAAHAPLVALLASKSVGTGPAIYDDGSVPQAATMPYLTIGAGTQVARDTFQESGYTCTLQVKVVGQTSEENGLKILSAARTPIKPGTNLTLTGYTFEESYVDTFEVHPTIVTTLAGVTTREWPAILRVEVHD